MSRMSFALSHSAGRCAALFMLVAVTLATPTLATPTLATAQTTEEAIKEASLSDLETMRGKFLGLAEAFPADKYPWRPMDGVRSVSEVLMLIANEGYGLVPDAFGGQQAVQTFCPGADKAQVIDYLTKGFAYAKAQVEAVDPATLTGTGAFFGQYRTIPQIVGLVAGDMHEHLAQLIAYARINEIVPPWSQ